MTNHDIPNLPNLTRKVRTRFLLVFDTISAVTAFSLALLIRYESFSIAYEMATTHVHLLIAVPFIRLVAHSTFNLYGRLWRYASLGELRNLLAATLAGSVVLTLLNFVAAPLVGLVALQSYSVFAVDLGLNAALVCGSRLTLRVGISWLISHKKKTVLRFMSPKRPVVIVGAGYVGTLVGKLIRENPEMGMRLVGYIDDDPSKSDILIQGTPVLGTREDFPRILQENTVNEVIIAMPTASQSAIDSYLELFSKMEMPTRVIPGLRDLLSGNISLEQMRLWRSLSAQATEEEELQAPSLRVERQSGDYRYESVMVTGGAGFIGTNFVRYMLDEYQDYRIVVFDKLTYAGNPDNLRGLEEKYGDRFVFVRADICDSEAVASVIQDYGIDIIVNFAAETHVDRSLLEPDAFLQSNVYGTYTLLEAARTFGLKRFHQVSTDEVYGQVIRGSFSEADPLDARSPYSASKAASDLLANAYYVSFGLGVTVTRGSNNIGPYQYPEKVVPLFVTNILDGEQPLPVYGDGLYVRDYQYVMDHCRGIDLVMHKGALGETYNIGSSTETSTLELATAILDRFGKPHSLIRLVEDRPGQDRRYSLNCSKIRALGWTPEWNFERALDETIGWYAENSWWWKKIKSDGFKDYFDRQLKHRLAKGVRFVLTDGDTAA